MKTTVVKLDLLASANKEEEDQRRLCGEYLYGHENAGQWNPSSGTPC